jgi:signal transduction histidine kinase
MKDQARPHLQTPEQWTRFLSAFAHELRTPLASFRMLADLLAEAPPGHLGEQERRYSEGMREVAQDVQSLIGEVAELARLMAGRVQMRSENVALDRLVDQVEEAVRPRAWEAGIALTDSLDPALPRFFTTDSDRLRQALTLLLGTAVSHAKSEVFFRLDIDATGLHVVISSDGAPFPEAASQVLFEPFNDGIRSTRPRGGRSLALPLAYELARLLGGTLRAENRGGRPAFDLSVPPASEAGAEPARPPAKGRRVRKPAAP